jgi:Protein of unknown function (DUF3142)
MVQPAEEKPPQHAMGKVAANFLVKRLRLLLAACLFLAGCQLQGTAEQSVNAAEYDSFWLWAGVKPQPVLDHAKQVYVLLGEVRADAPDALVNLRAATPKTSGPAIWMVVRTETLRWTPEVYDQLFSSLSRWRSAGNNVIGVQIDFDAKTRYLGEYAGFLSDFRSRMPKATKLSITGLLDWSANGDPKGLYALAGVVDEVVLQIYQGRRVIPGYHRYLAKLDQMPIAFRIGLLQGGPWKAPPELENNPKFQGYVVFLLNPKKSGS